MYRKLPTLAEKIYIIQRFSCWQSSQGIFNCANSQYGVGGTGINTGMFSVARLCEYHSALTHGSHLISCVPPPNLKFE